MVRVSKTFKFSASHILPHHPGKCSRLHGHNWELTVTVAGPVNPKTGFVCDYYELSKIVNTHIIEHLDHTHLGCGSGYTPATSYENGAALIEHVPYLGATFYPSSENLVKVFAIILNPFIQELDHGITLFEIRLKETCTCAAAWHPGDGCT